MVQAPAPTPQGPGAKLYKAKKGFANYYFNEQNQNRLLEAFKKQGDFSTLKGEWVIDADMTMKKKQGKVRFALREVKDGKSTKQLIDLDLDGLKYDLDLLDTKERSAEDKERDLLQPTDSGGLMAALFHYRELLVQGPKGFTEFSHGGNEPFYPAPLDGKMPANLADLRVDCEVLLTEHLDLYGKWYFSLKDRPGVPAGTLIGFELTAVHGADPCEVSFHDFKPVDGRVLPHKFVVGYKNDRYATFSVKEYKLAKAN
jgi:hypothetical protein